MRSSPGDSNAPLPALAGVSHMGDFDALGAERWRYTAQLIGQALGGTRPVAPVMLGIDVEPVVQVRRRPLPWEQHILHECIDGLRHRVALQRPVNPGAHHLGVLLLGFFIDFTVNFCSLRENPVFQNYQEQYERHRAV